VRRRRHTVGSTRGLRVDPVDPPREQASGASGRTSPHPHCGSGTATLGPGPGPVDQQTPCLTWNAYYT
jgi:hypothetical protein